MRVLLSPSEGFIYEQYIHILQTYCSYVDIHLVDIFIVLPALLPQLTFLLAAMASTTSSEYNVEKRDGVHCATQ